VNRLGSTVGAALLVLLSLGEARAATHSVSLLGVSGPGGGELSEQLEWALAELYDVVPGEVYRAAAQRLGHPGATPDEVKYMCRRLRLDALVAGSVQPRGVVIVVRDGATGAVSARGVYPLDGRPPIALKDRVLGDLARAFERVHGVPRGGEVAQPAPRPSEGDEEPADLSELPGTPETPAPAATVKKSAPSEPVLAGWVGVGLSLFTRRLDFDVSGAQAYGGGTLAAVRVEGGVFPFALAADYAHDHPILACLGLAGSYERAGSFNSQTASGNEPGEAWRWRLGALGRIPLGRAPGHGALLVDAGVDQLRYAHRSERQLGVPDVGYTLVGAGLGLDQPLGTRVLRLGLRLAFSGLVDSGPVTNADEYGTASGWAVETEGGLSVWPIRWLWLRAGARYTRVALAFDGNGMRFAHSAADQWIGGAFEVGGAL